MLSATLAEAGARPLPSHWELGAAASHWALGGTAAPPECGAVAVAPQRRRLGHAAAQPLGDALASEVSAHLVRVRVRAHLGHKQARRGQRSQASPTSPARPSAAQAAEGPRLVKASGSLGHALALKGAGSSAGHASGGPERRGGLWCAIRAEG